ncbi:hypothetical protein [Psychrobacillus psychrodurans]|nr:hypothetical protein [Psychrobacillus psychrodurans]MCZ8540815.1 hypothetical protein [Psychrobacillus psychrodurans]SFM76344.1 hypothetical protein SAMN05421832_106167 [Psychrobacillus psychrodurans]
MNLVETPYVLDDTEKEITSVLKTEDFDLMNIQLRAGKKWKNIMPTQMF